MKKPGNVFINIAKQFCIKSNCLCLPESWLQFWNSVCFRCCPRCMYLPFGKESVSLSRLREIKLAWNELWLQSFLLTFICKGFCGQYSCCRGDIKPGHQGELWLSLHSFRVWEKRNYFRICQPWFWFGFFCPKQSLIFTFQQKTKKSKIK